MTLRLIPALFAGLAATLLTAPTHALTDAQYSAERDRIHTTYRAHKAQCDTLKGNAEDVCKAQAKGQRHVARAELDAQRQPGAKADERVRLARAEAQYEVAKEKCDDLEGEAEDRCEREARVAHDRAKDAARAVR